MITFLRVKNIILCALSFFALNQTYAHGDLSKRIKNISLNIAEHPDSILLYHQRGVLYTQHGDFELALNDFSFCKSKNYDNINLNLDVATVYIHIKNYKKATAEVDAVLCNQPSNILALQFKGEILNGQEKYFEAAQYFEAALSLYINPKPENYILTYKTWLLSKHIEANCKALQILELGIEKLGPIYVLRKALIDFHLNNGDVADAIDIQKKLINDLNRKEHAYYDLALMKINIGMTQSAVNDLNQAKNAVRKLPDKIRNIKATVDLNQKINQLLKIL